MGYELGGQYHEIVDGSNTIDDSWLFYNPSQTSISIFGIAVYTPWLGGTFDVSIDLEGMIRDINSLR